MKRLQGRIAIVTGAGRGLGRSHALALASLGAAVVVNDLGGDVHGLGAEASPAEEVVNEIRSSGGRAVATNHNVADWDQAGQMITLAVEAFGDLHVLVNNAGILRDRTLANMTEAEWDAVISVHLKGHAAPTHHALGYWRGRSKAGQPVRASVIHTTSVAAFAGSFGQANYTAAKLGIIGLSQVTALEGHRYGVRSNAVSPSARTRIGLETPGAGESLKAPAEHHAFDRFDPANVSPLIAWLAEAECAATGQIFHIYANRLLVVAMPPIVHDLTADGRWTLDALDRELPARYVRAPQIGDFLEL